MAATKKKSEIIAEDETQAEIAEVNEADATEVPDAGTESPEVADETAEETKATKAGKRSAKAMREAEEEAERLAAKEGPKEPEAPKPPKRSVPNPANQHGKNYRAALELVDRTKHYELSEALDLAQQTSKVKFDASVEIHVNLGVDPRQADQMVRASVVLPSGTGKTLRVAVIAPEAKHADAKQAGADVVGEADLLAAIEKGKLDFDMLIATPDMMAKLGKVAKVLGPRGLMPNPKSGTVTADVAKAVKEAKAGKVEFRIDKQAIVHQAIGKVSFTPDQLLANAIALVDAVMKAKPSAAKGTYVKAMALTTSMGPGIKLDVTQTIAAANRK